VITIMYLILLH